MRRNTFLISLALILAVIATACGTAAQPTATPVPPTPTPAPEPTPLPQILLITASTEDFDAFMEQIPEADARCLTEEIGLERLAELGAEGAEVGEHERNILSRCFSNVLVAGFMAGQIQASLGSFSGSSSACVASLIADIPERALSELMIGTGEPESETTQAAIQGFVECLTPDELTTLINLNTDDPPPGGRSASYASKNEECMVGELGESFADGYGGLLSGDLVLGFSNAAELCGIGFSTDNMVASIEDTERKYMISDLTDVGFKKSQTYDVKGLESASSVHYGFYGIDPYNRLEYEVRFYYTHAAAREIGVEFANEATGANASLYQDDQRWQEGLNERRRCDSSGGHHVGRCGFPKYFDYVVVGNMVLMCQGKDTLDSLNACADLLDVLQ